jgi:hypothetical protein
MKHQFSGFYGISVLFNSISSISDAFKLHFRKSTIQSNIQASKMASHGRHLRAKPTIPRATDPGLLISLQSLEHFPELVLKECMFCSDYIRGRSYPLPCRADSALCKNCIPRFVDLCIETNSVSEISQMFSPNATFTCPCGYCPRAIISKASLSREFLRLLEPKVEAAIAFTEAVRGVKSDSQALDQKLCPKCQHPCSKRVVRHEFSGLSGGTENCNHIECPSCRTQLCFVCMGELRKDSYNCPMYTIGVMLLVTEAGIIPCMNLDSNPQFEVVFLRNDKDALQWRAFRRERELFPSDEGFPSEGPDALVAGMICVTVKDGVVTRVQFPQGDAPFRQVVARPLKVVNSAHVSKDVCNVTQISVFSDANGRSSADLEVEEKYEVEEEGLGMRTRLHKTGFSSVVHMTDGVAKRIVFQKRFEAVAAPQERQAVPSEATARDQVCVSGACVSGECEAMPQPRHWDDSFIQGESHAGFAAASDWAPTPPLDPNWGMQPPQVPLAYSHQALGWDPRVEFAAAAADWIPTPYFFDPQSWGMVDPNWGMPPQVPLPGWVPTYWGYEMAPQMAPQGWAPQSPHSHSFHGYEGPSQGPPQNQSWMPPPPCWW